ncbi:hypothetical protein ABT112_33370 [Streptomyces sp. NPDC002055]
MAPAVTVAVIVPAALMALKALVGLVVRRDPVAVAVPGLRLL